MSNKSEAAHHAPKRYRAVPLPNVESDGFAVWDSAAHAYVLDVHGEVWHALDEVRAYTLANDLNNQTN